MVQSMEVVAASAFGGVPAGIALSALMISGRMAGVLRQTLAERSEDWLDETFGARQALGAHGTTALEQANARQSRDSGRASHGVFGST